MLNWTKWLFGKKEAQRNLRPRQSQPVSTAPSVTLPKEPAASPAPPPPPPVPTAYMGPQKPRTLAAELQNLYLNRPLIFEPALRQYSAFRAGEPTFESSDEAEQWYSLRNRVLQHVLVHIGESPAKEHLILRGSALMSLWFGDRARKPGDLDFVVTPDHWGLNSPNSKQLITSAEGCLRGTADGGELVFSIPDQEFASDEIWIYEKAPGRRVIVPWQCENPKTT